jgi:hypothetical protein
MVPRWNVKTSSDRRQNAVARFVLEIQPCAREVRFYLKINVRAIIQMSIQLAEELKREWTDKYVMVQKGVPELRRFEGLTGCVKTVNMNCRLLVQFETPADISWYDIAPKFLRVVARPMAGSVATQTTADNEHVVATSRTSATSEVASGKLIDQIRAQKSGNESKVKSIVTAVSPLDQIRSQGAAESESSISSVKTSPLNAIRHQSKKGAQSTPAAETTSSEAPPKSAASSGSPLDQIRAKSSLGSKGVIAETPTSHGDAVASEAQDAGTILNATTESESREATDARSAASPRAAVAAAAMKSSDRSSESAYTVGGTLIDQVRAQAMINAADQSATDSRFGQIRRQAEADQSFTSNSASDITMGVSPSEPE